MKKIFIILGVIGIIIGIIGIIFAGDLTPKDTISEKLSNEGISGMNIVNISINNFQIKELVKDTIDYNLEIIYTKDRNSLTQDIYLTNNLLTNKVFNISTLINIDYSTIRWNGTSYDLNDYTIDNPLILNYWYDEQSGNLIVPNIFFDDIFNKRINYFDVAENGGYAIAYSEKGKYYINLLITKNINPLSTDKIDPTFTNTTQGFDISSAGTNTPSCMVVNNTDIYEMRYNGSIYHWKWDGTFVGACSVDSGTYYGLGSNSTATSPIDTLFVQANNGTLIAVDIACQNKRVIFKDVHVPIGTNFDVTGVAVNFTSKTNRTVNGYVFNAMSVNYLGVLDKDGVNKTMITRLNTIKGDTLGFDIEIDENNLSRINWIDFSKNWLHSTDYYGANITDYSFSTSDFGAGVPRGSAMNGSNYLISDSTDKFIYNIYCDTCYVSVVVPLQNITGRVVNASDYKAISGATIVILNATGGFVANTTSNGSGYWYYSYTNGTLINYTIVGYNTNNISQGGKAYPFISQAFG